MKIPTQKLTVLAMLAALSYALVFFVRLSIVPELPFLEYEPKSVIIVIAGFLFGALPAFAIAALVALLEMVTFSVTGPIGLLMNILATASFACTAAAIYRARRTLTWALLGLVCGCLTATGVMLLWNYLITPLYQGVARDVIAGMLLPFFLPFNLLKNALNAGFAMMLYRPVRLALAQARVLPPSSGGAGRKTGVGVALVSMLVVATCVLSILAWNGII